MKLAHLVLLGVSLAACRATGRNSTEEPAPFETTVASAATPETEADVEGLRCRARWDDLAKQGRGYGDGPLEQHRERMLGRARGATTLFVRPPAQTPASTPEAEHARAWFDKQLPGTC